MAPPRRRWRLLLLRICIGVLLLAVVLTAAGYLVVRHYYDAIPKVPLPPPPSGVGTTPAGTPQVGQNFLLVGSDTRTGVGPGFGSSGAIGGQRSDTVILAHLPAGSGKPTLVSFPRDSYVEIPAFTGPGGTVQPAHMDKLNTAFSEGGYALLIQTIEALTGLTVDHYVEVNFAGFEKMVDAVGGVTLCARTTRNDPANGPEGGSNDFMTAGVHHNVSGAVALAFVRDRHSFPDEDISRIHDQQYFIAQLIRKVESVGTLLQPWRVLRLLRSVSSSMRVDNKLSFNDMTTLIEKLRHTDPGHVRFVTVPFSTSNGTATIGGVTASVVLLDKKRDERLFAQLRTDTHSTGTGGHHSPHGSVTGRALTCGA